jgi:TolB protein
MKPNSAMLNRVSTAFGLAALAIMAVSCKHAAAPVVVAVTGAARDITRLTQSPQPKNNPAVSPDGKTVAFQVFKDGQSGIWTLDSASGRNLIQVTSLPCNEVHPSWLPDSRSLVFSSDR